MALRLPDADDDGFLELGEVDGFRRFLLQGAQHRARDFRQFANPQIGGADAEQPNPHRPKPGFHIVPNQAAMLQGLQLPVNG